MNRASIKMAINLFKIDIVNCKNSYVSPSFAQSEIQKLENELLQLMQFYDNDKEI